MAIPGFDERGDLPVDVHQATLEEVIARFGTGTEQRAQLSATLQRVHDLAVATGHLPRCILFGSYVTAKSDPNDIDIVLVMDDDFEVARCDEQARVVFDHQRVIDELGANVFWTRPAMLFRDTLEGFITHWQIKRDNSRRGIV